MVEKILKFLVVLVFCSRRLLSDGNRHPAFSEFVSSDYLKVGFLGITPLNLILGVVGALIFGYIGRAVSQPLIDCTVHFSEILAGHLADLPTGGHLCPGHPG